MNTKPKINSAILLIYCCDRKGLVAMITEFLFKNNGNIIDLEQHVDNSNSIFFMRVEWDLNGFLIPKDKISEYFDTLIASKLELKWELHFSDKKPRAAIFVSKNPHCLYDLLARLSTGEWNIEVPLIISNHEELEPAAKKFNVDYYFFNITKQNKEEQEKKQIELLKKYKIDFLILARYMQILTNRIISEYKNNIINIHHSFLPAFPGAKPYHSAYERGVKIIGATSHYVDESLDGGPIIEQNVIRVTHRESIEDLIRNGQDLEKIVLSKAVWLHINRKILVYNNRTIIFD